VLEEERVEAVVLEGGELPALRGEGLFDHDLGAVADEAAQLVRGGRGDAGVGQAVVEAVEQVGRGVDQRAVEIEDDGGAGHAWPSSCAAADSPTRRQAASLLPGESLCRSRQKW
jgi:hypothetical protein